jgi:hypothetical protein
MALVRDIPERMDIYAYDCIDVFATGSNPSVSVGFAHADRSISLSMGLGLGIV